MRVDYRMFSKKGLMEILDITQSALCCKNENDIKLLMEKAKELICAEHSICGLGVYDDRGLKEVKNILNASYPDGWLAAYQEKKLYEIDPIVWWHYKFFGTQIWTDIYKRNKDRISPDFLRCAGDFGLKFGIAGSIPSQHSRRATIISFAGGKNYFGAYQKAIMDILTPHFHQALTRVCRDKNDRKILPYLTPREREIIKWIVAGKTNWEISAILNISERTVKFHIGNIQNKLDAANKAHVAAIAMEQGEAD